MLTRRLEDLTLADIGGLNGVTESRFLDFKSAPVGSADKDRREFVADVTAFANASGGDIVFGVWTTDGVASDVPGITLVDPDKEKLRLGNLIRTATEPRLANFSMKWLPMQGSNGVLVVRVPRSWIAPHRVTLQGHDKFYIRNAAGKHPMNVDELRQAFTLADSVAERIRAFKAERVRTVLADEGPFTLPPGVKLIFHLVPLSAFVDPPELKLTPGGDHLRPLGVMGYNWRYTLEGYANYHSANGSALAYTLAFRNGIIEAVACVQKVEAIISTDRVELLILEGWSNSLLFFRQHGIEPPLYAFVTLTNMKGIVGFTQQDHIVEDSAPYRRDLLSLPELVVSAEQLDTDAPILWRHLFDTLANAFGFARSFNYAPDGQYKKKTL
jgi:Putative DNA-binding domain